MATSPRIIRRTHADASPVEAPEIDQEVISNFAKIADVQEVKTEVPSLETFLEQRYSVKPEEYTEELANIISLLDGYVEAMKRGANPTPTQQGVQVGKLNMAYQRALRSKEPIILFDTILWYFSFYEEEVFRAELPYRGIATHTFSTEDQLFFFQHITAIAQMIADIGTRNQRLRELDFHGAIRNVPKGFERHRTGLTTFIDYYTNF